MRDEGIGHPAYDRVQDAIAWYLRHASDDFSCYLESESFCRVGFGWMSGHLKKLVSKCQPGRIPYMFNHRDYDQSERERLLKQLDDPQFIRWYAGIMGMY